MFSVEFSAILSAKDEMFEDTGLDVALPNALHGEDFLLTGDMPAVLALTPTDHEFGTSAIAGAILQRDDSCMAKWSTSSNFHKTAATHGVLTSPGCDVKFLRTCSEAVLGHGTRDTHWLRTSASGGAPQLKREGAAAWRADIDRDLHLHYWIMPDGSIQLASVVHHNDFTIPNPDFERERFQTMLQSVAHPA
ncbi:MAG: hypothetical protein F2829_14465 [Actinobacteria bacterium]|nr:hypothetical protein [Actinomycetota bacterium]